MKPGKNRQLLTLMVILLTVPLLLQAQYKMDVPSIPGITKHTSSNSTSILGIDLSRIDFQNSYSMQVNSMGGDAVAIGLLKSSFNYTINPQVSVRGYVGLIHSPFSSIGSIGDQASFINGLDKNNVLYSGEISYRPKENMLLQIGFSRQPMPNTYSPYYSPNYYRPLGY